MESSAGWDLCCVDRTSLFVDASYSSEVCNFPLIDAYNRVMDGLCTSRQSQPAPARLGRGALGALGLWRDSHTITHNGALVRYNLGCKKSYLCTSTSTQLQGSYAPSMTARLRSISCFEKKEKKTKKKPKNQKKKNCPGQVI